MTIIEAIHDAGLTDFLALVGGWFLVGAALLIVCLALEGLWRRVWAMVSEPWRLTE